MLCERSKFVIDRALSLTTQYEVSRWRNLRRELGHFKSSLRCPQIARCETENKRCFSRASWGIPLNNFQTKRSTTRERRIRHLGIYPRRAVSCLAMPDVFDPLVIDLAILFPSFPASRREDMRDLLDGYCEVAYRVFARLEQDMRSEVDLPREIS